VLFVIKNPITCSINEGCKPLGTETERTNSYRKENGAGGSLNHKEWKEKCAHVCVGKCGVRRGGKICHESERRKREKKRILKFTSSFLY
jgi:hypothetical protein